MPKHGGGALPLAALLALAPALAHAADPPVTQVKAGAWQATTFRDPANPGCSIGGPGSVPGGRLIMGANRRRPDPMNLVIRKAGWAIPDGTPVQVQAQFPDGAAMQLAGRGKGQAIEVLLAPDQVRDWVHGLTASATMQLSFGGTEPPWTFDLTGTTAVVNAMGDCFRSLGIAGVAPPFGPATAGAATQPFGAAAPQPNAAASPPPGSTGGENGPTKKRPGAQPPEPEAVGAERAAPAAAPPPKLAGTDPAAPPRAAVRSSGPMPGDEAALLAAVEAARRLHRNAPDDVSRAAARPARAQEICRAVPPTASGWIGTVASRGATTGNRGTIAIRLAPGVLLKTWDDAASDFGDGTLMDPASPVFRAASALQAGQLVRFSASLIPDRADCYREAGATLAASINEPAFIMRLESIQAIP